AGRGIGGLDGLAAIDHLEERVPRLLECTMRRGIAEADNLRLWVDVPQEHRGSIRHVGEGVTPRRRQYVTKVRAIHLPPFGEGYPQGARVVPTLKSMSDRRFLADPTRDSLRTRFCANPSRLARAGNGPDAPRAPLAPIPRPGNDKLFGSRRCGPRFVPLQRPRTHALMIPLDPHGARWDGRNWTP